MKLPFMLKFPWGEETHFIEKLWALGINQKDKDNYIFNSLQCNIDIDFFSDFTPKLHTIRNASDRFKVGQLVQPFIWTYKPYKKNPNPLIPAQFDFMPAIKIVSKQVFGIDKWHGGLWPFINFCPVYPHTMIEIARNDGFNDENHFFQYFNKPVENMEIRHFTHLTY